MVLFLFLTCLIHASLLHYALSIIHWLFTFTDIVFQDAQRDIFVSLLFYVYRFFLLEVIFVCNVAVVFFKMLRPMYNSVWKAWKGR